MGATFGDLKFSEKRSEVVFALCLVERGVLRRFWVGATFGAFIKLSEKRSEVAPPLSIALGFLGGDF